MLMDYIFFAVTKKCCLAFCLPVGDFELFPVNNPTSFVAVVSACQRSSLVQA
jgi:hypothetical protein